MSDPARLFPNLDSDVMAFTRSQANPAQQRGSNNPTGQDVGQGRGRRRGQAPAAIVDAVQSRTGHRYETNALSPTTAQRAEQGLNANFCLETVKRHVNKNHEPYYAFQLSLSTPVAIRLYDPAIGRPIPYECSCGDFEQRPCTHIYVSPSDNCSLEIRLKTLPQWLVDDLQHKIQDRQGTTFSTTPQIELYSRLRELYPSIDHQQSTLPTVFDTRHLNEDESLAVERMDALCDVISYFDPLRTPVEFKRDFARNLRVELASNDVLVPQSLSATIYRLAFRDDTVNTRLQQIVPPDERAKLYYEKQYHKALEALDKLRQYGERGPLGQNLPANTREMDVPQCARKIRQIVHQMCEDREERIEKAPLGTEVAQRLTTLLVMLLERVMHSDGDIYASSTWNRQQSISEHPRERNLFIYLIGDPPNNRRAEPWMQDFLILDFLSTFPPNDWMHLIEHLTEIKEIIEIMNENVMPMAPAYAARIEEMLQDTMTDVGESSSWGA